jgi:Putative MetA-pathway of phenol degradation
MEYELAKQLKDAGFPQQEGLGGFVFEDGNVSVFESFAPHAKNPILEELIEAVDEVGLRLTHTKNLTSEWWSAELIPLGGRSAMRFLYRNNPRRPIILWLACATSVMICVAETPSAQAASPVPQPPVDLGETSFLDGEAGPGGLFEVIGNGYVVSQFTNASGGRVAGSNRQWIGTAIVHLAYVSNVPLAGGLLGAEMLIPASILHLQVPGTPQATEGGLGDVTFAPFIQWTNLPVWQRPLSVRLAIQGVAPTGQYSPNDPINAGSDAWQVSPHLAFTWRISDRWEISGRSIYDWSSRSN